MKKGPKILLIVLAIIIAIIAIIVFLALNSLASPMAILNIQQGTVQVNTGSGWINAKDGMNLNVKDSVKTGDDGKAVIILYESVIVQMDPNTEINLEKLTKENITINQTSGSTWNKFMNIAGIGSYSVATPTTVATVRGTGFFINTSDEISDIFVGEGEVEIMDETGRIEIINQFKRLIAEKGKEVIFKELTPKQKAIMVSFINKDVDVMRNIRERQLKRNFLAMQVLKVAYKVNEETLPIYLKKMDYGIIDTRQVANRSPVKGGFLDNIVKISDTIIEHKKLMNDLLENAKNDSEFDSLIDPGIRPSLEQELQEVMKPDEFSLDETGNNQIINTELQSNNDWCKAGNQWSWSGTTTDGSSSSSWTIKGLEEFKGDIYCHATISSIQDQEGTITEYYYKEINGDIVDMWMITKDLNGIIISEMHAIIPN